jgi:hypothetical protein
MFTIPLPLPDTSLILTPPWAGLPVPLRVAVLVLLCVVPLGLMVWLYRVELRIIPRLTALFLLALRLTVLALLLFLVCLQPVYARDRKLELPGRVLVVVDRSDSMDVADPQREAIEKLALAKGLRLAADLCKDEQLDAWMTVLADKKEIRWVEPEEAKDDPARRQQLSAERQKIYAQVLARADALTRSEAAQKVLLGEAPGVLARLQKRGHNIEVLGFHRESWEVPPDQVADLFRKVDVTPAGKEIEGKKDEKKDAPGVEKTVASGFTDLRLPLVRALEKSGPGQGKVLGVVLLTDGQHNSGEPPSAKARELGERGVPIYPIALGYRKPPPDVALVSVRGPNHTVFKDVDANIEVRFKIAGLKAQDFVVELHRMPQGPDKEKKLLAQRTLRHEGADREYVETFPVRLDEVGTQTLEASVRLVNPDEKETRTDNNRLATTLSVADDRARVLLIDGEARWEFHYLQTALNRDRLIEVQSVVFDQPRLESRLSPEELERLGSPKQQLPQGLEAFVRFRLSGLAAQNLVVELYGTPEGTKEKKLLGQKAIRHEGVDRDYIETFPVRMDEVGSRPPEAVIRLVNPVEKEARLDNTRLGTMVSVADALSNYQCIVLGDVDPGRLPLADRIRLERYVADAGGTLVILAGKRAMPVGYPEVGPGGEVDPLRKLLPIENAKILKPTEGFPLRLTTNGLETKFMELDPDREENAGLWAGRPRSWTWAVAGRAKPGATSLAYVPGAGKEPGGKEDDKDVARASSISEREKNQAVVVRHNYGFGRVLFVGLDSTWRWRYKVGDLYHHRFWGQAIRWAAADKPLVVGNQFVRFGTPQPVYRTGQEVDVITRLNDLLGPVKPNLLAGARVVRLPDQPGGKEQPAALVPLSARPSQPRVLDGKVRDLAPGQYAVELAIPELADKLAGSAEPGREVKPLRATFTMMPPESREMIDLEMRRPVLEDLAAKSGGKVFAPEEAGELAELLVKKSVPHAEHNEQRVYQWWVFLTLVVLLMTIEWAVRKWAGLP